MHLVAQYRQQNELPSVKDTLDDVLMEEIATQKQSGSCESVQSRIKVLLNDISSLVQSNNSYEELRITETKLITVKNNLIAPAMEISSALPIIHGPPNKNVEKQRSFQSFKKKIGNKIRFGNPSSNIRMEIQAKLLGKQYSAEDRKYTYTL